MFSDIYLLQYISRFAEDDIQARIIAATSGTITFANPITLVTLAADAYVTKNFFIDRAIREAEDAELEAAIQRDLRRWCRDSRPPWAEPWPESDEEDVGVQWWEHLPFSF